jgi:hypothetical protein
VQEAKIAKPVAADEAARKAAADAEVRYRSIAITNYKRCLQVRGKRGCRCCPGGCRTCMFLPVLSARIDAGVKSSLWWVLLTCSL